MNYQKQPPAQVIEILNQRNIQFFDIDYFAWPQTFGDTSGPCGGIGGQTVSQFTIEAYVCDGSGPTVYVCCGMYSFDDKRFEPFKRITRWFRFKPDHPRTNQKSEVL